MSINVYLTRRKNPTLDTEPHIGEQEWRAVGVADGAFREAAEAELKESGLRRPSILIWTGHPDAAEAWFSWTDGQIDVRTPDEPMIAKMMTLAPLLNARVISETGEVFNEDGTHKCFVDGEPW
jgi:hypothetical protein